MTTRQRRARAGQKAPARNTMPGGFGSVGLGTDAGPPKGDWSLPPETPRRRRRWTRWLAWLGLTGLGLSIAGTVAAWVVIERIRADLPDVTELRAGYNPPQISRILAADGSLLSSVFTQRRTVVPMDRIADSAKLAVMAAEDAHFYEHGGLRYQAIIRALIANVRAGAKVQGGSTLTLQVAEDVLLGHSRTYAQKPREVVLAWELEEHLTKDEILGLYLNHIFLGHGRYGVEEAARYYFGKHASELAVVESALIAGIIASPERYSPRRSPELALKRRSYVLGQMVSKGFITPELYASIKDEPIKLAAPPEAQSSLAPEAVSEAQSVLRRLEQERGRPEAFTVHTTIQPRLQTFARTAVRDALTAYSDRHRLWPPFTATKVAAWGKPFEGAPKRHRTYVGVVDSADDGAQRLRLKVGSVFGQINLAEEDRFNPKHLRPSEFAKPGALLRVRVMEEATEEAPADLRLELGPQGALVAIDVRSRDVVALVGSYEGLPGGLDRAQDARRQPASAFKPFVYSAALHDRLITPATVFTLSDPKGHGVTGDAPPFYLSARSALAHSNNEAAVNLLVQVGPEKVVKWAHRLGIQSKLGPDTSLALGSYEVSPLEMASAYATFASGGIWQPARVIAKVEDGSGAEVPLPPLPAPSRVLEPSEAYLVTSLLRSVVEEGTAQMARTVGVPVAAKTGTTNDVKDAWLVGFSTELAVAVWIGYDDAQPLGKTESGTRTAVPAFAQFMTHAHEGRPAIDFPRPPGVIEVLIDPASGLLAVPGQPGAMLEEFLDGTAPDSFAPQVETAAAGTTP